MISDQNGANLANCGQNPSYPNGSLLGYVSPGPPSAPRWGGCTQSATPYKFTAQRRDAESGLDQFHYRKYSPLTGRWLSPDPAGLQASCEKNPQTFNRYAYTLNSPATYRDRDGRFILWGDWPGDGWPGYGGGWGWYPSWCQPYGFSISVDGIDLPECPAMMAFGYLRDYRYTGRWENCHVRFGIDIGEECIYGWNCTEFMFSAGDAAFNHKQISAKYGGKPVTTCPPSSALSVRVYFMYLGLGVWMDAYQEFTFECSQVH